MARCIHSYHATGEHGEDLGWVCAFCHRLNRATPGVIVPTDPARCAAMCVHFEQYTATHPQRRMNRRERAEMLYDLYVDEWGDDQPAPIGQAPDLADHPNSFQRRPAPPRRQIPPAKMAERYK